MGIDDDDEPHADLVFMGGARVGKTSLLHRLLQVEPSEALDGKYKPTIEDSYVREFLVAEQLCRLRLVDTAGGYTFPAMQKLWVKRASAFVLVCARDVADSLNHLRSILTQIKQERADEKWPPMMVIAINKCDLHMKEWVISDDAVEALAEEFDIPLRCIVLTSAFIDMGVTKMMKCLWRQNAQAEANAIQFEQKANKARFDRRASAFAAIFGTQNGTNRPIIVRTDSVASERSGSLSPQTPPFGGQSRLSSSAGSPKWLAKTFRKLSTGTKEKTSGRPSVIDMQCIVS